MSSPDPNDILLEPLPLTRAQQFLVDRLHALAAVANDAETILAPAANDRIVRVMIRIRGLFDQTNKLLQWGDYNRAADTINRIEAGLGELRSIGKELGMHFIMERIIP